MSQDRTGKSTQVVHVRENSDSEMEALFKNALGQNSQIDPTHSTNLPMRMRKLPQSFFKPPEPHNHHSRDSSTDSTGYSNGQAPNGVQNLHLRAHSSPASLQQTLSVPALPTPQHVRQQSCDLIDSGEAPLPQGWEMAKTPQGQRYYLNHHLKMTTWVDPRKTSSQTVNNHCSPPQSQNVPMRELGPLPPNWEQARTAEGEIYFINHLTRTTSWFDPRITRMQQQQVQQRQQSSQQQQQPPPQLRPQPVQGQTIPPPAPNQGQPIVAPLDVKEMQLQQLRIERENLRKRQEEIMRQEMLLTQLQPGQAPPPNAPLNIPNEVPTSQDIAISQASEMTSITDPFLGSDHHSRQESTDSGLGGMGTGTNYTLPRTPEDFLSNVDEMETQDGGHRQGDFNTMDIGNIGDGGETSNMDSEDLVPSLHEDLGNELLNDVENVLNSSKMDNFMTWL